MQVFTVRQVFTRRGEKTTSYPVALGQDAIDALKVLAGEAGVSVHKYLVILIETHLQTEAGAGRIPTPKDTSASRSPSRGKVKPKPKA